MAVNVWKSWCRVVSHVQAMNQTPILFLCFDSVPACHPQSTISSHRFTGGTSNSTWLSPVAPCHSNSCLSCQIRWVCFTVLGYSHMLHPSCQTAGRGQTVLKHMPSVRQPYVPSLLITPSCSCSLCSLHQASLPSWSSSGLLAAKKCVRSLGSRQRWANLLFWGI